MFDLWLVGSAGAELRGMEAHRAVSFWATSAILLSQQAAMVVCLSPSQQLIAESSNAAAGKAREVFSLSAAWDWGFTREGKEGGLVSPTFYFTRLAPLLPVWPTISWKT